jgi:biotin transporter BioY
VSNLNAVYLGVYCFGGIMAGHIADKFVYKKNYIFIAYSMISVEVAFFGC